MMPSSVKTNPRRQFVVLAEVQEEWTTPIDTRLQPLGGKVICESRAAYVEDLVHQSVDADKAQLEEFKTKVASAKTERMESALEKEIQSTAEKLRRKADKAQKRLDHRKEELDAKIKRLEEQASQAKPETKSRIEQRTAELRKDFDERLGKLRRAYEMTQEALRA